MRKGKIRSKPLCWKSITRLGANVIYTSWLEPKRPDKNRYRIAKDFHVSPFLGMDIDYAMVITPPTDRLIAHMDCRHGAKTELDATLHLHRTEITGGALARVLCQYPVMTLKVATGIYWQALKLWWKKCPIFSHPGPTLRKGVS